MFNRLLLIFISIVLFFCMTQVSFAQEPGEENVFIYEEEIGVDFKTELEQEEPKPQFITADILTIKDVEPAINFYVREDITKKFSGMITNLKVEKFYGIIPENKKATVYFDYSYTSLRNKENILYEKGKMTLMRFNSGKWFNDEPSIFLKDIYPYFLDLNQRVKEE